MGEYFMTGVPAVLTDVGEIHKYVKDGVNAYLVETENPQRYADKLCYILDNYETALATAKNATDMIINNFSCKSAALRIEAFIRQLKDE
jgi:glycosyltransferase involved in cell wall biosynthesis